MKKILTLVFMFTLISCGLPRPHQIGDNEYELQYCADQSKCFKAAEKTCKNKGGYSITRYSSHPERFVCKED